MLDLRTPIQPPEWQAISQYGSLTPDAWVTADGP